MINESWLNVFQLPFHLSPCAWILLAAFHVLTREQRLYGDGDGDGDRDSDGDDDEVGDGDWDGDVDGVKETHK